MGSPTADRSRLDPGEAAQRAPVRKPGALRLSFLALLAGCATAPITPEPLSTAPLQVAGRPDVLEIGPLLRAAETLGPSQVRMMPGGVPNLFSDSASVRQVALDRFPGQADLAGQAETQALRLSTSNPDLRIIMTVTEGVYRIVARRSAGIGTLADLRGKRVGTFVRTSAAYFLHRMLASAGLSEADIVLVPMRPNELAAALAERRVDAIAIWEPESERGRRSLGDDAVEFSNPAVYRELYNLNTTATVLADPHKRAAIVRFVRALIEASEESASAPQEVWRLVAQQSGVDAALVAASWPHHRFPAALPADLLDMLVEEENWLAAQDKRPPRSRADLARLIDPTIIEEARAGR